MTTRFEMLLGNKIKELRESRKLLQRQMAISLGIDVPMYSRIERGERRAKSETRASNNAIASFECRNGIFVMLMASRQDIRRNS